VRSALPTLLGDRRGAAAAEMVLVMPFLLALMFGAAELGNYFFNEHILVKGVRDAAIFASRRDLTMYDCASGTVNPTVVNDAKALTRKGQFTGGVDRLPNWDNGATVFTVTVTCTTIANGTTLGGIYTANNGIVPYITVTAKVPYLSVGHQLGFNATTLNLNASEQAAVVAI
jgi:Flp pilus assembly protein TadG